MRLRRCIRVAQVTFHSEIFTKAMQNDVLYLSSLAEPAKAFTTGEGNRARPGKNLGRKIQKNFVYHARGQRGPVYQRSTFNQQACNLQFTQTRGNSSQIGASVIGIKIGFERYLL